MGEDYAQGQVIAALFLHAGDLSPLYSSASSLPAVDDMPRSARRARQAASKPAFYSTLKFPWNRQNRADLLRLVQNSKNSKRGPRNAAFWSAIGAQLMPRRRDTACRSEYAKLIAKKAQTQGKSHSLNQQGTPQYSS